MMQILLTADSLLWRKGGATAASTSPTFPATDFAASILGGHVPLNASVQHPQQDVHAGKGLRLSEGGLPLLYCRRHLGR